MTYRIKPEFLDMWGAEATEETVLTENDLEMITRGWDKTPADIMGQLTVNNYDAAVALMDDDIREAIHSELAPCSEIEFLKEYEKRHLEKHGTAFEY